VKNKRILVIEDEFLIALDIISVLEDAGFREVRHIETEEEALMQIERHSWDAAIADANLNGRSIEQVARVLRERGVPFLVVTGYGRKSLPAAIGAAPILEKPFQHRQLLQTLIGLCGV